MYGGEREDMGGCLGRVIFKAIGGVGLGCRDGVM